MRNILFVAVILALCVPARAEDAARKINFMAVLTDQDGEAMLECADNPPPKEDRDCKARRPVTLGMVAMRSLSAPEQGLAPEKALQRGQLALSVYKSSGAELTADEIKLIKDQVAKFYGPLIVVRAFAILDPASIKSAP